MGKFLDENGLKHLGEKIKERSVWEKGLGENSVQTVGTGCVANGDYSVAEGNNTLANNTSEHAEGQCNVSNYVDNSSYGNAGNTQHSIGIGTDNLNRKNAFEVMQNGDTYLIGVGDYDGTNYGSAQTLQSAINKVPTLPTTDGNYILQCIVTGGVPTVQWAVIPFAEGEAF